MSRLARVMKVVADAIPGDAAVLSSEGVPAWVRHSGELGDRLVGDGDLLLDLADVTDVDHLVATRVLDRWASALDFSLRGIYRHNAFRALMSETPQREFVASVPSMAGGYDVDAFASMGRGGSFSGPQPSPHLAPRSSSGRKLEP